MKSIKMFLSSIIFLSFLSIQLFAQPEVIWTKTFGDTLDDIGTGVLQTKNGDFIVCGYFNIRDYFQSSKPLIIRTNSIGDTMWTKNPFLVAFGSIIPSPPIYEYENGNIIIGTIMSGGLLKINSDGDSLYWKLLYPYSPPILFGSSGVNVFYKLSGDSIIFCTYSCSDIGCDNQIYLHEFQSNSDSLNLCWDFDPEFSCNKIIQSKNGNIIVFGTWLDMLWENHLFLISIDKINGDTLWTKIIGEVGHSGGESIVESSDNGFMILSDYFTEEMNLSICLIKTNEVGDSLYSKFYCGDSSDIGEYITNTSDDGYIIVGSTNSYGSGKSDVWLLKTDENGDTLWTKTIGGTEDDYGVYVQQTSDGGYIVVGTTYSYGNGGSDIWLIRLSSDPTSIEKENSNVKNFVIYQNYPNPFNPSTTIEFDIPTSGFVSLKVFNIMGQEVAILLNKELPPGNHKVEWKPENLSSGIYYCRLQAGEYQQARKMILLK